MTRIWVFNSTGDAYDACQCNEEIQDGDCLLVEEEGVVGLAWTWPIAVTKELGDLHGIDDKPDSLATIMKDAGFTVEQVRFATETALQRGFALDKPFIAV
jgi:hypothetical protein